MTKPARARQLLPLTVWLCPDDAAPQPPSECAACPRRVTTINAQLARHLITACTQPGDLVVELYARTETVIAGALDLGRTGTAFTSDPEQAAAMWDRLCAAYPPERLAGIRFRIHSPGRAHLAAFEPTRRAALVVAALPPGRPSCSTCPPAPQPKRSEVLYGAWRALSDGGHLAVVTAPRRAPAVADERFCDLMPQLIRQARLIGFAYTQHVVALRAPVRAGELVVQVCPPGLAHLRDARSIAPPSAVSLHADVLIFTKRGKRGQK